MNDIILQHIRYLKKFLKTYQHNKRSILFQRLLHLYISQAEIKFFFGDVFRTYIKRTLNKNPKSYYLKKILTRWFNELRDDFRMIRNLFCIHNFKFYGSYQAKLTKRILFFAVYLPSITYNQELDKLVSNVNKRVGIEGICLPVTSTFAIFDKY